MTNLATIVEVHSKSILLILILVFNVACLKIKGMAVNTPVINLFLKQLTSTVWINKPEPFIVFEK